MRSNKQRNSTVFNITMYNVRSKTSWKICGMTEQEGISLEVKKNLGL